MSGVRGVSPLTSQFDDLLRLLGDWLAATGCWAWLLVLCSTALLLILLIGKANSLVSSGSCLEIPA